MGLQPQNFASNLALFFFGVVLVCSWEAPIHPSTPQFYACQQNRFRPLWIPGLLGLMCGIPNGCGGAMNSRVLETSERFPVRNPSFSQFLASFWLKLPDFPVFGCDFEGPLDGFHHFPWPSMANGDQQGASIC